MGNDGDGREGDKPFIVNTLRGEIPVQSAYTYGRMSDPTVLLTLAEVIKRLMDESGIHTAKELVARTKTEKLPPINKDTISRLLNNEGTPERETVERIARVFRMHAEDLYERQRRPVERSVTNFPARRATDHAFDVRVLELAKSIAALDNPARVMDLAMQIAPLDNAARVVQLAQQLARLSGAARLAVEAFLVALDEAGAPRNLPNR